MLLKEEEFFTYNAMSRPAMILGVPIKLFILSGLFEFPILLFFLIFGKFTWAGIWLFLMFPIYFYIKYLSTKDENIIDIMVLKIKFYLLRKFNYKLMVFTTNPFSNIKYFFIEKPNFKINNNNLTFMSFDYDMDNLYDYKRFFEENIKKLSAD